MIKAEIENIQREQILYRNKILTLENYELQYLAPKLTTGNNHNYHFSSEKLINNNSNDNIDKIYYNIKNEMKEKNKIYSNKKRIKKHYLNRSLDYKYNNIETSENENRENISGAFNKILTKSKKKIKV